MQHHQVHGSGAIQRHQLQREGRLLLIKLLAKRGARPIEKPVEELKGWLEQLAAQIPGADGLSAALRERTFSRTRKLPLRS